MSILRRCTLCAFFANTYYAVDWTRTQQPVGCHGCTCANPLNYDAQVAGQYRFGLNSTRASRVFVDGACIFDEWHNHFAVSSKPQLRRLSAGMHLVRLEFCSFAAPYSAANTKLQSTTTMYAPPQVALRWTRDDFGLKVYVYELPSKFNSEMLRKYPKCRTHMFAPEQLIHQSLAASSVHAWARYAPPHSACTVVNTAYCCCAVMHSRAVGYV